MQKITLCPFVLCLMLCTCVPCDGKSKTKKLNALTFNTWLHESLIESYNGKEKRKEKIIKGLKSSKADVVCLQEVYIGQDLEDIIKGVRKQYPYSFSELHKDVNKIPAQATRSTRPPCNKNLLDAYSACISSSDGCNATAVEQNAGCIFTNCLAPSLALFVNESQECITCISMSMLNIDVCSDQGSVIGGRQMNKGGLALLSNKPLRKGSFTDLYPSTKESISRGYLTAEIKDYATVMCVHLSPVIKGVFVEPELLQTGITSYPEMNTRETNTIIKRFRKVKRGILMGDINTGPAFTTAHIPKLPRNYKQLQKQFKTKSVKDYTYKDPKDETNQSILDHIFVKGISIKNSKRVFVPRKDESPISDHIGVQCSLRIKK